MDLSQLEPLGTVIRQHGLLEKKGFAKKLGQNFLLDPNITDRIARAAGDLTKFCVIEVGPGPGGLTRSLLHSSPLQIYAIEKDPNCIRALAPLVDISQGRLSVVQQNALKVCPQNLSPLPLKIVANLPYNIGTQLLLNWLKNLERIASLTLMFQREVALRIVANPGTASYGRLSILCQYLCQVERLFDLPPQVFTPAPKVFSTLVQLHPKALTSQDLALIPKLEKVTAAVFCQRRKMIRKSLKSTYPEEQVEQVLKDLNLSPTIRPETLTLADYLCLAKGLP